MLIDVKYCFIFVLCPAAVVTTTISTVTTDTAQPLISSFAKFNNGGTQAKLSSEEYRRLGEEFFQILNSQGFPNSYNFLHSGSNHAGWFRLYFRKFVQQTPYGSFIWVWHADYCWLACVLMVISCLHEAALVCVDATLICRGCNIKRIFLKSISIG